MTISPRTISIIGGEGKGLGTIQIEIVIAEGNFR